MSSCDPRYDPSGKWSGGKQRGRSSKGTFKRYAHARYEFYLRCTLYEQECDEVFHATRGCRRSCVNDILFPRAKPGVIRDVLDIRALLEFLTKSELDERF